MPLVKGLPDKTARPVAAAVDSLRANVQWMAGSGMAVMFVSDSGSAFWHQAVKLLLTSALTLHATNGYAHACRAAIAVMVLGLTRAGLPLQL